MRMMFKRREEGSRARRRVDEGLSGALDEIGLAEVCQKHTWPHQTSPILHHARRHHQRQPCRDPGNRLKSRRLAGADVVDPCF